VRFRKLSLTLLCLLIPASLYAAPPEAERHARRCQGYAARGSAPRSGALLWGTWGTWEDSRPGASERRSVLVSVDVTAPLLADPEVRGLHLDKGRLVASPQPVSSLVGTVLRGTSSEGKPVEVALCGVEPAPADPDMAWYRIEAWSPVAQAWVNPCVATSRVPDPRAVAINGVWDSSGAHQQVKGKLTLACENSAIAQCIRWGYKPWASLHGQSLAELHQACTRLARADYCGDGTSHALPDAPVELYDKLGVRPLAAEARERGALERSSFEAAWAADGAVCLARTRDGRGLEEIQKECPGRFTSGAPLEVGDGDRCALRRAGVSREAVVLTSRGH
jgi:ADYC domain